MFSFVVLQCNVNAYWGSIFFKPTTIFECLCVYVTFVWPIPTISTNICRWISFLLECLLSFSTGCFFFWWWWWWFLVNQLWYVAYSPVFSLHSLHLPLFFFFFSDNEDCALLKVSSLCNWCCSSFGGQANGDKQTNEEREK